MSQIFDIADLQHWDDKIRALVDDYGLDCYPQEFELCDHNQMLSFMAYSGMPAHYPHWSYGKSYEKQRTLYDYGVGGLPYEMVINSNPSLAYLMRDNSLALQILTIAHVYGHNDFFKNNFTFRHTRAEHTLGSFKLHADRVRDYIEDPSIGIGAVEEMLDAAHSLSLNCRRNLAVRKPLEAPVMRSASDPHADIHPPQEAPEMVDETRIPATPEEDLLLFIRDHNAYLAEWQRDLLTIVHEEAQYFLPQIETKIMNEGWASFWHHEILAHLDLPQSLYVEFLVHHHQVVRPIPGQINPYHLGLRIWQEIRRRHDEPTSDEIERDGRSDCGGLEMMFQVREVDRDASFLRRFLTHDLMRELDLFEHEQRGEERIVSHLSSGDEWERIKRHLIQSVGLGGVPVIRIVDADYLRQRILYLEHVHDGRDLQLEHAQKTLEYLYRLWGREVLLATKINDKAMLLAYGEEGFGARQGAE